MPRPVGSKNKAKIPVTDILTPVIEDIVKSERPCVKGWIVINKAPPTRYAKAWYYCGGDIHDTREDALKVTAANRVAVVYIECEVR